MTTSIVVGGILLSTDDLLRVVQLTVGSRPHLVTDSGLKINVNGTGNVLSGTSLTKEGVEGIISSSDGFVAWHLAIGLDAMLKAVELPAAVTGLDTGLAHVDRDTFCSNERGRGKKSKLVRNLKRDQWQTRASFSRGRNTSAEKWLGISETREFQLGERAEFLRKSIYRDERDPPHILHQRFHTVTVQEASNKFVLGGRPSSIITHSSMPVQSIALLASQQTPFVQTKQILPVNESFSP